MDKMGEELNPVLIQTLAKIPGLCYFSTFYWKVIGTADSRAEDYPMMHNPDTPASLVLSYMLISLWIGPRLMKNRETPAIVQPLLLIYNVIVIHMNLCLAIALTHHVISGGYNVVCNPVEPPGKRGDWVMSLLYGFYCSKIIELVDTLFLVLKKKNKQLTFLHIYHHSTIIAATWIGVKFVPGGTTTIIAMINSWVHVFMYVYYEMMAANVRISRKYKQFLTIVQITQFCFTLVVCSVAMWFQDCGYTKWVLWWLFLYMMSFLILFGKFFVDTYQCGNEDDIPEYRDIPEKVDESQNQYDKWERNGQYCNSTRLIMHGKHHRINQIDKLLDNFAQSDGSSIKNDDPLLRESAEIISRNNNRSRCKGKPSKNLRNGEVHRGDMGQHLRPENWLTMDERNQNQVSELSQLNGTLQILQVESGKTKDGKKIKGKSKRH